MMRTIYDYKDIRKLDKSLISEELESGIIITATSSLAESLRAYYPDYVVIGIYDLISELIPEWDESTKNLQNYISLRNSIDNFAAESENSETLYISLQRNAADIWNAILLLVEADVYPDDIPEDTSIPIQHFKKIWKQLEIDNSIIMNLRTHFLYHLSDREMVFSAIQACLKRTYKHLEVSILNRQLYFLGFYFITPIQARIMDVISYAGIKISYLNCRDIHYPCTSEIWEKTFSEEYLKQEYVDIQPNISLVNSFGDMLNGEKNRLKIEVVKYASDLEFAQALKGPIETGASIFTPDIKKCEEILKEYYPDLFKKKHLLAFPVGQYIYYLHMMWNSIHGCLELKYDFVFKCFASGWLEADYINGREYLFELSKLEPFFKDCISFDDWRIRLQRLKEIKECLRVFDIEDGPNKRWHELLGNPFKQLSIFNMSRETLDEIEVLLIKLMDDAEFLFSSTGKVRISEHFSKITKIINEHLDREDVLEDEIQIAKELVRSLEYASLDNQECPLSAIKDAILLLIGGHFDEIDSLDQEKALIGEKIAPLSKVESSILDNYGEDIYLVLADEFTLPGKPRNLPWPLSDELLDSLQIHNREDTERYVHNMRSIIDNRPLSYRYLFFSFLSNVNEENHPQLHISWIKNQREKKVSASPYVLLMWPETNKIEDTVSSIDFENEIKKVAIDGLNLEIDEPKGDIPEDVLMDYSLCKYRYLYSYLVNYLPEFKSEFHYPFLLTSLIDAFCSESGKSKEDVSRELFELFPFLRSVEQHQAFDYSTTESRSKASIIYDNSEYPASRQDIHFIKAKGLAVRSYESSELEQDDNKKKCMYCPYAQVCIYKNELAGGANG